MGRRKRQSAALRKARKRLAGVEAINPSLNLGNGLTAASYRTAISQLEANLKTYNTKLSKVDELLNIIQRSEDDLNELSDRLLRAIAGIYGTDSDEYEKAGGTRKSEKKKPSSSTDTEVSDS